MASDTCITFAELRRLLEEIGYRYKRVDNAEVFYISRKRMLLYRLYADDEHISLRDIMKTRGFLDDWNQMEPADFDAFVHSASKPA